MLNLQFAPDAKYWHRLWSVRFAALGAVVTVASVVFPGVLGYVNPFEHPGIYASVSLAFFVAIFAARLTDQTTVPDA